MACDIWLPGINLSVFRYGKECVINTNQNIIQMMDTIKTSTLGFEILILKTSQYL